jgi:predicted membrane-bound spermidine synthase
MEIDASAENRRPEDAKTRGRSPFTFLALCIYIAAFLTGAIVMSFEMLGSRYLGPYFGSGIYTWAALISTVLAALCIGYFLGGSLADRHPSPRVLGATVAIGSVYLLLLPAFADLVLQFFVWHIDDIKLGSIVSALAIMLLPVTLFGMYSPFAIRLLLRSEHNSGVVSGTVYGVSTAGSILGTLGTTFFLIPLIGSRAITLSLGILGIFAGALLVGAAWYRGRHARGGALAVLLVCCELLLQTSPVKAEDPFDSNIRAEMLKRKSGQIAHIESVYNDIFVIKDASILKLAFQWNGWHLPESQVNLADPDDLPMLYPRAMSIAAIYPQDIKRVLVLGLGAGSIPVYLNRFLPDATIDGVELDPGVIDVAKKYFGLRETNSFHLIESDARVFLNRHARPYDLIMVDAFTGSYIPFHLMTKEFYQLVHDRLAPHGVAALNIVPSEKLFDSNVRTLKLVFDNLDFFNSGDKIFSLSNVIVLGRLDPFTEAETLQRAVAAQDRYKFRFDLSQLVAIRRIETPKAPKGEVLTDDFAPANVFDAYGRRYRRQGQPDDPQASPPQ